MTKDLKLEECVNLLNSSSGGGRVTNSSSSAAILIKKTSSAPPHAGLSQTAPTSSAVSGGTATLISTPGSCASTFSAPPASKMIRRSSKNDLRGGCKCTIRLLDDNEIMHCDFQSHHKGQFLMDYVCRQLNIAEKDYFGLRYVDSNKQRHWLDLGKSIIKQLKDNAYILCFRIKFYPSDPLLLKEEVSRYQLVLQLRRDILHGRLYSTLSDMATIVSFILQSELGDYDPEVHLGNYAAEYEVVARQSQELEEKAMELHQKLKGLTPSEADTLFLKKAASLDTYGVDPHPVKDQQGEQVYLGINHTGISTFQGSRKSTHFKWTQITKLNYEAKMFIIHLSIAEDSRTKKKETVGFKCQTSSSCKFLWRCAVEQRLFFNCGCATDVPSSVRGGGIFGSRFRYYGRVQREILEDPGPLRASDAVIQRTPLYRSLQRSKTRSLPHSPSNLGYGSLPRSNHSAPPNDSMRLDGATMGSSTSLPLSTLSSPYCPEHTLPILETLQEDSPRVEDKGKSGLVRNGSIRSTTSVVSAMSVDAQPDLTFLVQRSINEEDSEMFITPNDTLVSIQEETEEDSPAHKGPIISELPEVSEIEKAEISISEKEIENKQLEPSNEESSVEKTCSVGNGSVHHIRQENHTEKKQNGSVKVSSTLLNGGGTAKGDYESNGSAFMPVYNNPSEATEAIMDDKVLRESKIDHITSPGLGRRPQGSILSIWKVFIVCFICVLLALFFVAVLSIEVDLDICRRMRKIPEVEYFQLEIYEPLKNFFRESFVGIKAHLD